MNFKDRFNCAMKAMQILKYSTKLSCLRVICVSQFWASSDLSPLLVHCAVALQPRLVPMPGSRIWRTVIALPGHVILIVNEQQNTQDTAALGFFFWHLCHFCYSLLSTHIKWALVVLGYGRACCLCMPRRLGTGVF